MGDKDYDAPRIGISTTYKVQQNSARIVAGTNYCLVADARGFAASSAARSLS
jgi:hypothetical protein